MCKWQFCCTISTHALKMRTPNPFWLTTLIDCLAWHMMFFLLILFLNSSTHLFDKMTRDSIIPFLCATDKHKDDIEIST